MAPSGPPPAPQPPPPGGHAPAPVPAPAPARRAASPPRVALGAGVRALAERLLRQEERERPGGGADAGREVARRLEAGESLVGEGAAELRAPAAPVWPRTESPAFPEAERVFALVLENNLAGLHAFVAAKGPAEVARRNAGGFTPLHFAAQKGFWHVTKFLVAQGADLEARNAVGKTALHLACYMNQAQCVEALLQAGADRGARDRHGRSPCDLAALMGHKQALQVLERFGQEVEWARITLPKVPERWVQWTQSPASYPQLTAAIDSKFKALLALAAAQEGARTARRGLAAGHFARRAADRKLAAVLDEFEGRHRDAPADAPPDAAAADPAALRLF